MEITYLRITIDFPNFVGVLGPLRLSSLVAARSKAEDAWDNVSSSGCCTSSFHPQGHLYVGLALSVRVILRIVTQSLSQELANALQQGDKGSPGTR
jgi:hypothetical protein